MQRCIDSSTISKCILVLFLLDAVVDLFLISKYQFGWVEKNMINLAFISISVDFTVPQTQLL